MNKQKEEWLLNLLEKIRRKQNLVGFSTPEDNKVIRRIQNLIHPGVIDRIESRKKLIFEGEFKRQIRSIHLYYANRNTFCFQPLNKNKRKRLQRLERKRQNKERFKDKELDALLDEIKVEEVPYKKPESKKVSFIQRVINFIKS